MPATSHRHLPLCLLLLLLLLPLGGCGLLQREPLPPSHRMRDATSDSLPTGMDDRARQIESNLGIR